MASLKTRNKRLSNQPVLFAAIFGILASVVVFIAGFGAMWILYEDWLRTDAILYPGLKGLFDYKASFYGDAVCLPLIVGAGTTYILYFRKRIGIKGRKSYLPLIFGLIGGLFGALLQAQWLISDTTILNWSIPTLHQFNTAGWWHAGFFVVICFLISYIAANIVSIDIHLKPSEEPQGLLNEKGVDAYVYTICQFIIWFCGLLFLHFHYLDDYSSIFSEWKIIGIISIFGALILLVTKQLIHKKQIIRYYSPVALAVIISTLVSFISISPAPSQCDNVFLIAGILCTSLWVYNSENKAKMAGLFLAFALFEYLCQMKISECIVFGDLTKAWIIIMPCLLCPLCFSIANYHVCERKNPYDTKTYTQELAVAIFLNTALLLLSNPSLLFQGELLSELTDVLNTDTGAALIFLSIAHYIKCTFERIKNLEYNTKSKPKEVNIAKTSQYLIYFLVYFAGVICLWNHIASNVTELTANPFEWYSLLPILILLFCILGIRLSNSKTLRMVLIIFSYIAMLVHLLLTHMRLTSTNETHETLQYVKIPLIIYLSCIMATFIVFSILYNTIMLRQRTIMFDSVICSIVVGILGGMCYGFAAYQLLILQTIFHALQLYIIVFIAFCLIPGLCASRLDKEIKEGDSGILKGHVITNVMQDGFLFGIIVVANTIIDVTLLDDIFVSGNVSVLFMLGYVASLYTLWNYCMENNKKHKEEKRPETLLKNIEKELIEIGKRLNESPLNENEQQKLKEEQEKLRAQRQKLRANPDKLKTQYNNLVDWLRLQNWVAVALAFPYSLVFIFKKKMEQEDIA